LLGNPSEREIERVTLDLVGYMCERLTDGGIGILEMRVYILLNLSFFSFGLDKKWVAPSPRRWGGTSTVLQILLCEENVRYGEKRELYCC
jgi:hypothetical protein